MAGSLRDQLVQAGLATSAQAKKAEREARVEKTAHRNSKPGDNQPTAGRPDEKKRRGKNKAQRPVREDPNSTAAVRERARKLNAEKTARDRDHARIANEKAAAKAKRAEIKQIILQNDQRAKAIKDDDVPYNFVHGRKIKKIYVPAAQRDQLSSGSLVIVNNDGIYHLVSKAVSEQISARDAGRIILARDAQANPPTADDEYYAKFEVPDDLDW